MHSRHRGAVRVGLLVTILLTPMTVSADAPESADGYWLAVAGTPSVESTLVVEISYSGYGGITLLPFRDGERWVPFDAFSSRPYAEVKSSAGDHLSIIPPSFQTPGSFGAEYVVDAGHEYLFIVLIYGNILSWNHSIVGDKSEWNERGRGDDVVTLDAAEMAGDPGVSVRAGVVGHVSTAATWSEAIEGELYGFFGRPFVTDYGAHFLAVDSPTGYSRCACLFQGAPSGSYEFAASGVGVDPLGERPLLVLADIPKFR